MRVRNKLLLDRWEALRRKSMSREGRVHTKLMQKQREEMQNLRDWMTEMEDRISQVTSSTFFSLQKSHGFARTANQ